MESNKVDCVRYKVWLNYYGDTDHSLSVLHSRRLFPYMNAQYYNGDGNIISH